MQVWKRRERLPALTPVPDDAESGKNLANLSRQFAASADHGFEFQKSRQLFIGTHNKTLPVISRNFGYRHMPRRAEKHGIAVLPGSLPWSRSRIPWIPRN